MGRLFSAILSLLIIIAQSLPAYSFEDAAGLMNNAAFYRFSKEIHEMYSGDTGNKNARRSDGFYKSSSAARVLIKAEKKPKKLSAVKTAGGYGGYYVYEFFSETEAESAIEYYKRDSSVENAELDGTLYCETESGEIKTAATDIESGEFPSWGSERVGADVLAGKLKDEILYDVNVAVMDTGAEVSHELLKGRVKDSKVNLSSSGTENSALDDGGHGTLVAGVIASNTPKSVTITAYKILNADGYCPNSVLVAGMKKAVDDGADIINLSLSSHEYSAIIEDAVKSAYESGVAVIAAAGNYSLNCIDGDISTYATPACVKEAVTVSNMTNDSIMSGGKLSDTSDYGYCIDLCAPGTKIKSSFLHNTYSEFSGTSLSAPFVTAAFAVSKALYPDMKAPELESFVKSHAVELRDNEKKEKFGSGMVYMGYLTESEPPTTATPKVTVEEQEFSDAFELGITCFDSDVIIKYRLNCEGDYPGRFSGTLYTEPIVISEAVNRIEIVAVSPTKKTSKLLLKKYVRSFSEDDYKTVLSAAVGESSMSAGLVTDINGDGVTDAVDVLTLRQMMTGNLYSGTNYQDAVSSAFGEYVVYKDALDINRDGVVDAIDAYLISRLPS